MNRTKDAEIALCLRKCLPEFKHVNHYWDNEHHRIVAKILPGEFYATTDNIVIATTLGSCISACIWDQTAGIGGMNHFMLPLTTKNIDEVNWGQRGLVSDATRYGNFAMEHLINTLLKNGARRPRLLAKIFGGGKVLTKMSGVGQKNIDFVLSYLMYENIEIISSDIGLACPRKILFEPSTGRAFVKRLNNLHNDTIIRRENDYLDRIDHQPDGDVELF